MPTIFEKEVLIAVEKEPVSIHVHVRRGGGEAVFDVEDGVDLRESYGLKVKELTKAQELAEENRKVSTLIDTAKNASYGDGEVVVQMASGSAIRFPIAGNRRLCRGTEAQLNRIEISPFGLHWPELNEDLSLRGIVAGDYRAETYGQLKLLPAGTRSAALCSSRNR